jgi:hypothetical protein
LLRRWLIRLIDIPGLSWRGRDLLAREVLLIYL